MDAQIVDASSFFIPSAATIRPNEGALIELRHGGETAALSAAPFRRPISLLASAGSASPRHSLPSIVMSVCGEKVRFP